MLPNLILISFILSNLFLSSFTLPLDDDSFSNEEKLFTECEREGEEFHLQNFNCEQLPSKVFSDVKSKKECFRRYKNGCIKKKNADYCDLGVLDLNTGRNPQCLPINPQILQEFGMNYYEVCCKACGAGYQTYTKNKTCEIKDSVDLDGNLDENIEMIKKVHKDCCLSMARYITEPPNKINHFCTDCEDNCDTLTRKCIDKKEENKNNAQSTSDMALNSFLKLNYNFYLLFMICLLSLMNLMVSS